VLVSVRLAAQCGCAPVNSEVMPHGKAKVASLHFQSGEGLAQTVHFAEGVAISRLRQARAPAGRSATWSTGLLDTRSLALHQTALHRAPCKITCAAGHGQLRSDKPGWLALTGRHNKSVEMDAQVRPCAARTRFLCATHVQR
jgi:hypothetical protein